MQAARSQRAPARLIRNLKAVLLYTFLVLGAFITCFPFVWMILTSFKNYAEAIATPPTILPGNWIVRGGIFKQMLVQNPALIVVGLLWLVGSFLLARRIEHRGWAAGAFVALVIVFPLLGAYLPLGNLQFGAMWDRTVADMGIEIESFWANYVEAWGRAPFAMYFRNSLIMATLNPLLIILTSAPAAYAFARLDFPAKSWVFMLYLATMMVPSEVILIPNFITISDLGWRNTFFALVIPYSVSVMSIFFLRQFFMSVPNDLYDAATIDGCGHVRFLISIAMPLARPALVSTAMFNFLGSWNALLWPLLVTDEASMRPIALGLASFSTEAGMQAQLYMAAATFTILPIIILFLFVQRQFIEGIARSGIK